MKLGKFYLILLLLLTLTEFINKKNVSQLEEIENKK